VKVENDALIFNFYSRIVDDARIGSSHITLYLALLLKWESIGKDRSLKIKRDEIMRLAKINSRQTYNKRMKELHTFGYIIYSPCADPNGGSCVSMEVSEELKVESKSHEAETDLYNRKEIAAFLRISLVTLIDWTKHGLPSHKQGGRIYFDKKEVLDYIKEKKNPGMWNGFQTATFEA
jgi:hypothetical protein